MPPINVLLKPASGLCNMSCDYCFYRDETGKREVESYGLMSQATLKNVVRKTLAHAGGYAGFLYQGGEPTLCGLDFYRAAAEYQRKYNKRGIRVNNSLQTNGVLIDEEWCRFFRQENYLIGLSVDGTEELHNKYRHDRQGGGAYEKAVRAARLFDRYGVEYNILTVVTKDLAENIEKVYRDYGKRNWMYQQYILCLDELEEIRAAGDGEASGEAGKREAPDGTGARKQSGLQEAGPRREYSLTVEGYGEFLVRLFRLWQEDYRKGRQPYIREFYNYIRILQGYLPESCAMRGVCSIQNVVEANGNVYPCDFYALDEFYMGNYNENSFEEIQDSPAAKTFVEVSRQLPEECAECEFFRLCRGGCRRNRLRDGEGWRNQFCGSYQRFFRECLGRLREIANGGG